MRWLATLLLVVVAWCVSAEAAVVFKILTASGFVAFPAEDHWPVISMKTKPPIAVAIFQIPNPADRGTPESTNQGAVEYSLVDAKRQLAGAAVAVRLAWPHLKRNPSDYDRQMEATLRWVLASIYEHVGPYERRDGDRILRPPG